METKIAIPEISLNTMDSSSVKLPKEGKKKNPSEMFWGKHVIHRCDDERRNTI
jgi:hypothetical protein